jgi:hypothetical protein
MTQIISKTQIFKSQIITSAVKKMNVLRYRIGFSKLLIEKGRILCQHLGINKLFKATNECVLLIGYSVGIQEGTALGQERIQQSSSIHHGVRLF